FYGRIRAQDFLAQQRRDSSGIGSPDGQGCASLSSQRHVDGWRRRPADLVILGVVNQADDLPQVSWAAASAAIKLFAEDALTRKEAPGERLIHHDRGCVRIQITRGEVA